MKIQIDTTEKVIRVEEKVNLGTLYNYLRKFFPNNEWKKYSIDAHTTIQWAPYYTYVPIYEERPYNPYVPWITWYGADVVALGDDGSTARQFEFNSGVYNVEIGTVTEIVASQNS